MSSYLTFYVQHKGDDKKHPIMSYSRNNDIYRAFDENMNIAFCYNKIVYTELTEGDITLVLNDLRKDIDSAEKRIQEYEKHANGNPECIDEIIQLKEYVKDLEITYYKILTIEDIISDIQFGNDVEHVFCNIS